ncbi:hypothetical protein FO488_13825 [Geobacter sp. FeAm09]|uniref:hypothetical protein n=1 Tax=Geobacter sp. FeAm09 TaxID=2597769 RepID=UPI0011EDBDE7|nr:hypothetical protein [Geobacter sp. FeAm09]QEM69134.1 hypothetical protein FO488_13825 [Geobacter sp. FeAm09]
MKLAFAAEKMKVPAMALGSLLVALYLWGSNLRARWGIIDDHEIMKFLGPDGRLAAHDFWQVLLGTEFALPGTSLRYRPAYYLLRVCETFVWGDSPVRWYACRVVLFALSVMILWWLAERCAGFIAGLLFTLYVCTFPWWADIWAKLGPAETYAVFGTALYAAGFVLVLESTRQEGPATSSPFSPWLLMLVGAFVAMGSKENLLFLLLPVVALLFILWKKGRADKTAVAVSALMCGYGIFIAAAVATALGKAQKDIYANSVKPIGRLELLYYGMVKALGNGYVLGGLLTVAVIAAWVLVCLHNRNDRGAIRRCYRSLATYLCLSAALLLVYASQFAFYNGQWPAGMRYDFPGGLCGPVLMFATAMLISEMARLLFASTAWRAGVLVVFSLVLGGLIVFQGFEPLRAASHQNAEQTRTFTSGVSSLAQKLRNDPAANLVFISFRARDHEPIGSLSIFLRTFGVKNRFVLYLYQRPQYTQSKLDKDLAADLLALSRWGSKGGWLYSGFSPLNTLDKSHGCYRISFSASGVDVPDCVNLGQVW